jgi:hypothetical protein
MYRDKKNAIDSDDSSLGKGDHGAATSCQSFRNGLTPTDAGTYIWGIAVPGPEPVMTLAKQHRDIIERQEPIIGCPWMWRWS